jgi:hypothetical protein
MADTVQGLLSELSSSKALWPDMGCHEHYRPRMTTFAFTITRLLHARPYLWALQSDVEASLMTFKDTFLPCSCKLLGRISCTFLG